MKFKTKKITSFGIFLFLTGIALGFYSNSSTYIDSSGLLHENFSTPLSALFVIVGLVIIMASFVFNKIPKKYFKKK